MFAQHKKAARFDAQIDALKDGIHKVMDRVSTESAKESTRMKALASKAGEVIQEHPFAAVGIAFGVGYVVTRIARR